MVLTIGLQITGLPGWAYGQILPAHTSEAVLIIGEGIGVKNIPDKKEILTSCLNVCGIGRTKWLNVNVDRYRLSGDKGATRFTTKPLWFWRGRVNGEKTIPGHGYMKGWTFPIIGQSARQSNWAIGLKDHWRWWAHDDPGSLIGIQRSLHGLPLHNRATGLNDSRKAYGSGNGNHDTFATSAGIFVLGFSYLFLILGVRRGIDGHGWQSAASFSVAILLVFIGVSLMI
ncbi:protein of unknown function [Nitrospira defluvii]|jgi:hypothetical protein|uniref:Uncharacterized protein n=1 Tax=Nitrospira defluvii TaxID=330214 RepID=D8PE52_9BACT|nr:protein of unknown function [Nitrospira defluvii]